jgi:hypothetical protein
MNKERERQAVEDLRRLDANFPAGVIEEHEVPDFIVRAESSCLGIEVTEYFRPERPMGSHPKEQEALTHQITDRATTLCRERGAPPLWAAVSFTHGVRLLKRDVEVAAAAIADTCMLGGGRVVNEGQLPPSIDDITVHLLGPKHDATVTAVGTTWVPPADENELARIVASKEAKLDAYRSACDAVWLLIVIDGFQLSSMTETPTNIAPIPSSFDRVLVLHDRQTITVLAGDAMVDAKGTR